MLALTDAEVNNLLKILRAIQVESDKQTQRRYRIRNYCGKAHVIIRKAQRRNAGTHTKS